MARIVLISCASKKASSEMPAGELYASALFKKSLAFAKSLNPEKIFILSAKHGLVGLDEIIAPYNQTLNSLSAEEQRQWSEKVLQSLRQRADIENDEFVFLAGKNYRRFLAEHIRHFNVPMQGLGIGKQLSFLKKAVKNE